MVLIDLTLAGDNAVVVALAAAGLPARQRRVAVIAGIAAARHLAFAVRLRQSMPAPPADPVQRCHPMSQPQAPAAAPLPLFFRRIAGVSAQAHGHLRLDRSVGCRFAAAAQSIPLGLTEIEAAAQHFPVLFTGGPTPSVVGLLGLREGENLFVRPDGTWMPEGYQPAYARAFPFIFIEDAATRALLIGVEPDAPQLSADTGVKLFEDSHPSAALTDVIAFCKSLRDSLVAAGTFAKALDAAGILENEEATVNFTAGGTTRIRGFKIVKPERLAELDDATFLDWRRMGWVAAIYAHLYSIGRWGRLIELAAASAVNAS